MMIPHRNKNYGFILPFFLFMVIGAWVLLEIQKGDVILYFSGYRSDFLNLFFKAGTLLGEAYMYIIGMVIFLFIRYRNVISLLLLGSVVLLVSWYSKNYFHHARPFLFFRQAGTFDDVIVVPGVILNGGHSSFPSGHTLAAFALYALLAFFSRSPLVQFFFFLVALFVGFSRIYLVQHFFEDIYFGAIMGVVLGGIIYWIHGYFTFGQKRLTLFDSSRSGN